jgi:predicted transcriptional regulator
MSKPKKTIKKAIPKATGKSASLTIRLDPQMARLLDELGRQTNKSRSEIARDALNRQLRLARFEAVRKRLMPYAEARGILTDEDVFAIVS